METQFSFLIPLPPQAEIKVSKGKNINPETIIAVVKKIPQVKINLGKALGLSFPQAGKKINRYLKVALGQTIKAGQILASKKTLWEKKEVTAPQGGEVYALDRQKGILTLRQKGKIKKITSPVSGKVIKVEKNGVTLMVKGKVISLTSCQGKTVFGPLENFSSPLFTLNYDQRGKILLVKKITPSLMAKSIALNIKGLISRQKDQEATLEEISWGIVDKEDFLSLEKGSGKLLVLDPRQKKAALIE